MAVQSGGVGGWVPGGPGREFHFFTFVVKVTRNSAKPPFKPQGCYKSPESVTKVFNGSSNLM